MNSQRSNHGANNHSVKSSSDVQEALEGIRVELGGGSMSRALDGFVHTMQSDGMGPLAQDNSTAPSRPVVVDSVDEANQDELDMTLNFLRLQSARLHEELDEDAIEARIFRTNQLAKRRVVIVPDLEADSDEEENRLLQGDAYQEEEDLIARQDLCKQISKFAKSSNFHSKKTISWLKRRIGCHSTKSKRNYGTTSQDEWGASDYNNVDDASPLQKKRRLTRGMARHTRVRKREERMSTNESFALHSLLAAAEEFVAADPMMLNDPLYGHEDGGRGARCISQIVDTNILMLNSKPEPKVVNHSAKSFHLAIARDSSLDLAGSVRASEWLSENSKAEFEVDRTLVIKVTTIIIGGNNFEPIMRFLFKVRVHFEFLICILSI